MIRGRQAHAGQVIDVVAVSKDVHRFPRQVAAFGQDPARPHGLKAAGRLCQISGGPDLNPGHMGGFGGVGGEQMGQGEQLFGQPGDTVGREQREAAACGQHRVQHQGGV